jgi:hypothetical protein
MKKIFLCLAMISLAGCINFKSAGSDAGEGLSTQTSAIGGNLIKGVVDSLTTPEHQKKLQLMLEELIEKAGGSANKQAVALRDSLIGVYTREWIKSIRDELTGEPMRKNVAALLDEALGKKMQYRLGDLRDELLGPKTRELVAQLVSAARNAAIGDSAAGQLANLIDTVLGGRTNAAIRGIVDSAMVSLVSRYNKDLAPALKSNLSFLQDNVVWILVVIGIIALSIIGYVWWQKRRYLKLTELLTNQIHNIPDEKQFEAVKTSISTKAKESGLEKQLRELLDKQGLLGDQARRTVPKPA